MSTAFLLGLVVAILLVVVLIVGALAMSFLVMAIAFAGLLYRYAEEKYPEALGTTVGATGIKEAPQQVSRKKPLGDIDNDAEEDEEAEPVDDDEEWLSANPYDH